MLWCTSWQHFVEEFASPVNVSRPRGAHPVTGYSLEVGTDRINSSGRISSDKIRSELFRMSIKLIHKQPAEKYLQSKKNYGN